MYRGKAAYSFLSYSLPREGWGTSRGRLTKPRSEGRYEVFGADEAAELFYTYYNTGDIPAHYALRPVEGYPALGGLIDLRDGVPRPVE